MDSAPLAAGEVNDSSKHRWVDSGKVYSRKSFNNSSKLSLDQIPDPPSSNQTLASSTLDSSFPPPPTTSDDSSSLNCRLVTISLASKSKLEVRDLRRKLAAELDQVRSLVRKLESRENSDVVEPKKAPLSSVSNVHRQLSVSVVQESSTSEKEKRTAKVNQYYKHSDFLLGKEKLPPLDSQKKSKSSGSKIALVDNKLFSQAFKSCVLLLSKLMKHKHGWVFNTPVDVKALGLHDYSTIIKNPMDLGTVKSRISKNWYKSPEEFAEDVRLTFRNAMKYNPKGQDVHVMAEQLLQLFEELWPSIEGEYTYLVSPRPPPAYSKRPTTPINRGRVLERSDSTVYPLSGDSKTKPVSYTPQVGRPPTLKKPKAKDLNKRDMTFEEKQKLSDSLQNFPPEKLDNVVQIIKKRNTSLSQNDDEIEVDIDSVDIETLWELDRFVTNYKKSLSKNKKVELAEQALLARSDIQAHIEQERMQETEERTSDHVVVEEPKKTRTVADDKNMDSSSPRVGVKRGGMASRSTSSSSSSSKSRSSSSDSDSDTSSVGSDVGQSPRS